MKQPEYTAIIIDYFLQLLEVNCPLDEAIAKNHHQIYALRETMTRESNLIAYELIDRIAKQIGGKR